MLFNILILHLLALISPGPDFLYVAATVLNSTKKEQLKVVLGITTGIVFWSLVSLLGLSLMIQKFAWFIPVLSILGGAYLLYLAIQIYKSRKEKLGEQSKIKISFWGGVITNPKAIIYFSSIFSIYASKNNLQRNLVLLILMWSLSFFWFLFLSILLSHKKNIHLYQKKKICIDTIISLALLILPSILIINQTFLLYEKYY
ncbi:LysE family transporter [Elizabethkingia argentiflava]|uniref:LysE family transporter n=1 Tax=Elizabethkingia argenteiflava TaxID=2681556 RepID=A0A845PVJ6_9FLAO|nr:LysE family transporter [Elizabethkingia argenteiflava]NAW52242.1 LysE family transporter [Elizabethkingia argenteiflava]